MNASALEIPGLEVEAKLSPERAPDNFTLPLLLEVGCEEIPARFLRDAEKALGVGLHALLEESRLLPVQRAAGVICEPAGKDTAVVAGVAAEVQPELGPIEALAAAEAMETYSTPRRLVVYVPALLARQPDKIEAVLGPPVKVAIDAEGNYTRAAQSFAQKNGARIEDLARTTTPKGEYLSLKKTTAGRSAAEILAEILPTAILGLSFPKSMYWTEKSGPRFVRPIRWVLAILGDGDNAATVEFKVLGVKSGNFTFGHRVYSKERLVVENFRQYAERLRTAYVEFDRENRRKTIQTEVDVLLEDSSRVVRDADLEEWLVNSTEWPSPIRGGFEKRFLHLPREILITVMRDHQKYFAVEDETGNLEPYFVTILNVDAGETGLICRGHERVLRARFSDAEFFWNADQHLPLRERLPLLDKVTYQAKLGSYGDKIRRMLKIAESICATLEIGAAPSVAPSVAPSEEPGFSLALVPPTPGTDSALKGGARPELRGQVLRAIELSKCDLTTQMVQEFTELQGVVGGLYAKAQGEPEEISRAVYDHYLPLGAEGASPRTLVGALVSLADKVDSVVAGFAAGEEPTGSSDPFALRRQANGTIKVLLEFSLTLSLKQLVKSSLYALETQRGGTTRESGSAVALPSRESQVPNPEFRVLDFLAERLRYYFESVRGFRYDTVRAVMAAGADQPTDALARAEAMEALRGGEDFEALSAAAKRIRNILAKSATSDDWQVGEVSTNLLREPQETDLYADYQRVAAEAGDRRARREYRDALEAISTLRPVVDRFFDKVLVIAEDREVRQNRLRLLKKLDELFSSIAHFAEIAEGK